MALGLDLAERHPTDRVAYTNGKAHIIAETLQISNRAGEAGGPAV
jgi:hypothetical protein